MQVETAIIVEALDLDLPTEHGDDRVGAIISPTMVSFTTLSLVKMPN
jgi:hypothetical protein